MPLKKGRPNPRHVFINCPFDERYRPLLRAMQFTVLACGFEPRCALEEDNAAEVRVSKIMRLLRDECGLGIHDVSRTERFGKPPLPRFNMPFELGLHLGSVWARTSPDRAAGVLILDSQPYRYQRLISDIAGQDIRSHGNTGNGMISAVRKWLNSRAGGVGVPGTSAIQHYFRRFSREVSKTLGARGLDETDLSFATWSDYIIHWLNHVTKREKPVCPSCGR